MSRRNFFYLVLLGLAWLLPPRTFAAEPEKSVVFILTFSQEPDWASPWLFGPVQRSSGSGFVVEGNRIMTNAHVVSWAKQILVFRYQNPTPYLATVEYIGHDCDLALLKVEDSSFFDEIPPLHFGSLPEVRTTVTTYGYPAGGEQISYTKGVVSRVEVQTYAHISHRAFLAVQTDAAINPGNSGGPVIQDDLVVGVAFQGLPGLENTGFFIPVPIALHFLADTQDGYYHGFPQAGIRVVPLQNPAYRNFLKLPGKELGARVDSLLNIPTTQAVLKPDDVLLKVGPYDVASDGTIFIDKHRVNLAAAFHEVQHGESVPLKTWREGAEIDLNLQVFFNDNDRAESTQYDTLPRYYIYGGLVFTPLSLNFLKTVGGADRASEETIYELYYRKHEKPDSARQEPIMLSTTLAHEVNANVSVKGGVLVNRVNGKLIQTLEDVIQAFETASEPQHSIEFLPHNALECLDRSKAETANAAILEQYGITQDRRL